MKFIYSAPTSPSYLRPIFDKYNIEDYLLSYAVDANNWLKYIKYNNVIIDSGAFTAWNKGEKIDIQKYRQFCEVCQMKNNNWIFVNLDIIPKTNATIKDKNIAAQQGFQNFLYLKQKLKNVLPVHHYGDDYNWFEKYMQYTDYIGLSPANDTHENIKQKYLDFMFSKIPENIKTHAFGYTSAGGMKKYPFYTIDSISYKAAALFGNVTIYNRKQFTLKIIKMAEFRQKYGFKKYKNTDKIPIIAALEMSIHSFIDYIYDINNSNRDYSFLKKQQTLF